MQGWYLALYHPEIIAKNLERARKRGIALTRRSPDIVRAEAARLNSLWDEKNRKLLRSLTKGEEEFIECEQILSRIDFRHWASCYGFCEVDASEGGGLSPVKFWQGQRRVLDLMGKRELEMYDEYAREKRVSAGILVILHKIRQCGITALWRLILQHRGTICHKNFRCMSSTLASPDDEFKKALYNRDRVIYDNLPYYLKPALAYDVKKEQLQYEKMGRFVYTDSGQQAGIGTGNQWDGHHITECALWQEQLDRLIFSLLPGIPKGLNVIGGWESTADGRGNPWHDLTESVRWQKRGFEHWVYAFIPWWQASEKYADPCPPLHVFAEVTLKHAEMVEATSPEFNDGKPYRLTREQMFWWEGQYFYHKERRALGMFYSNYPATPEESFQSVHKGALSYEVLESIRHTAHVKGMPYEVKLGATQLTDGGTPAVHLSPAKPSQNNSLSGNRSAGDSAADVHVRNGSSFPASFYVGSRGSLTKLDTRLYDDDPRGLLWLWEPPDVARYRYFLGLDPSHGITGWTRAGRNEADVDTDNSTIWVLREGRKVANEPDLIQVGEYAAPVDAFDIGFIANIIGRIFGREDEDGQAKLCHEAFPGPGPGTTRTLIECGYTNLWHWEYFAGATVAPTQTVGWQASPRNNTALWEKSKRLLSLPNNIAIKSPWTYEELASAVVLPGKFWPEVIRGNGRHDDRLRACQLAMWAAKGWSLDAETVVEHVRTDPTPIDWAATDMSMEQIHDAWNDHFDKMYGQ